MSWFKRDVTIRIYKEKLDLMGILFVSEMKMFLLKVKSSKNKIKYTVIT